MTSFQLLGLPAHICQALKAVGLETPTPVQQETIPLLMAGRDAIVLAKTGSGKTLAFGLPLIKGLKRSGKPQGLVVVPTRELAVQILDALQEIAIQHPLRVLAVYGGVGYNPQSLALKNGVDLVVGTPGRLRDLRDRGDLDLSQIRVLVLDEADRMLDMGFRQDLLDLLASLPAKRQTALFSATMPESMEAIARQHLQDPALVKLTSTEEIPDEIRHFYVRLKPSQRLAGLWAIIQRETPKRAIIFTQMKHETRPLADKLARLCGAPAGYLNGNMTQTARHNMLERFRAGELRFLVATDVAARGLDIDGVTHVIHYTVPTEVDTYIHRSGRTGRAGHSGKTIILVTPDGEKLFNEIRERVPCREIPAQQLGHLPPEPKEATAKKQVPPPAGPPNRAQRRQALQTRKKKQRPGT